MGEPLACKVARRAAKCALVSGFFVLVCGIILTGLKVSREAADVRGNCAEVPGMYTIGDQGHRNKIYDCNRRNTE